MSKILKVVCLLIGFGTVASAAGIESESLGYASKDGELQIVTAVVRLSPPLNLDSASYQSLRNVQGSVPIQLFYSKGKLIGAVAGTETLSLPKPTDHPKVAELIASREDYCSITLLMSSANWTRPVTELVSFKLSRRVTRKRTEGREVPALEVASFDPSKGSGIGLPVVMCRSSQADHIKDGRIPVATLLEMTGTAARLKVSHLK